MIKMLTEQEYQKLEEVLNKVKFTAPNQAVEFKKVKDNLYQMSLVNNGMIHTRMVRI